MLGEEGNVIVIFMMSKSAYYPILDGLLWQIDSSIHKPAGYLDPMLKYFWITNWAEQVENELPQDVNLCLLRTTKAVFFSSTTMNRNR